MAEFILKIDEGRVYGARYHTVQPNYRADTQTWFRKEWDAMVEWCVEVYGPTPKDGVWTPNSRWYVNNAKFWFRKESDMTMFIIRWS
jgi:hypothetical protein